MNGSSPFDFISCPILIQEIVNGFSVFRGSKLLQIFDDGHQEAGWGLRPLNGYTLSVPPRTLLNQ